MKLVLFSFIASVAMLFVLNWLLNYQAENRIFSMGWRQEDFDSGMATRYPDVVLMYIDFYFCTAFDENKIMGPAHIGERLFKLMSDFFDNS